MKLGISTASFFTKVTTEDTFEYISDFGVKDCEVFLSSFCEYSGRLADEIVSKKNHSGVNVYSVHALTNQYEPELFSLNPRAERDAESILRDVMSLAKRLNASYYTFHGASRLKQIKYTFDYDRLSKVVGNIIDICDEYGVRLSYENVHWAYGKEPEYLENMFQRCPKLYGTLDIKQAKQAGLNYRDFLQVMQGRLSTVHLCDYREEKLELPGNGNFDFVELFSRLDGIGFDGACLMEVYPQNYKNIGELKLAYEYLLECADKAGIKVEK